MEVREGESKGKISDKSIYWVWCGDLKALFTLKLTGVAALKQQDVDGMRISIVCTDCLQ